MGYEIREFGRRGRDMHALTGVASKKSWADPMDSIDACRGAALSLGERQKTGPASCGAFGLL